jgi:hypothetical protein
LIGAKVLETLPKDILKHPRSDIEEAYRYSGCIVIHRFIILFLDVKSETSKKIASNLLLLFLIGCGSECLSESDQHHVQQHDRDNAVESPEPAAKYIAQLRVYYGRIANNGGNRRFKTQFRVYCAYARRLSSPKKFLYSNGRAGTIRVAYPTNHSHLHLTWPLNPLFPNKRSVALPEKKDLMNSFVLVLAT